MRHPRVVLMDEPAAGLINSEIDELDGIIRYFAREMRIAVMLVEHRLELLAAIADRVVVLDLGHLIAEGRPDTVFEDPLVRAAYFETETA
jgi:ABC-type branched-subunit amino acid transport system ATPase component